MVNSMSSTEWVLRVIILYVQVYRMCCSIQCGMATFPGKKHSNGASNAPTRNRIIGGWVAPAHSYPWIVQVRKNVPIIMQSFCGGTLIQLKPANGTEFVLTAAHCLYIEYT
uniref:Peptidase S1 domain-containing protein n=1 Tax=Trichuris muris TaxID=70415 RepID=A0A5S6QR12_TRIMR